MQSSGVTWKNRCNRSNVSSVATRIFFFTDAWHHYIVTFPFQAHWHSITGSSWPNHTWPPSWIPTPASWPKVSARCLRMPCTVCPTWKRTRRTKSTEGRVCWRRARQSGARKRKRRKRRRVGSSSRCAFRPHRKRGGTKSIRRRPSPHRLPRHRSRRYPGLLPPPPQSRQSSASPPHRGKSLKNHRSPFQQPAQQWSNHKVRFAPLHPQLYLPLVNATSHLKNITVQSTVFKIVLLLTWSVVCPVKNPGKCQSSTFSTYTFTTCRILHPSDITQVTTR